MASEFSVQSGWPWHSAHLPLWGAPGQTCGSRRTVTASHPGPSRLGPGHLGLRPLHADGWAWERLLSTAVTFMPDLPLRVPPADRLAAASAALFVKCQWFNINSGGFIAFTPPPFSDGILIQSRPIQSDCTFVLLSEVDKRSPCLGSLGAAMALHACDYSPFPPGLWSQATFCPRRAVSDGCSCCALWACWLVGQRCLGA